MSLSPSATTDPSLELRDIKPVIEITEPGGWPLWASLALVALAVSLGVFAWWRWRRRRPLPTRDPGEIALAELAAIRDANSDAKTYAMAISDILRRYIQARFHIGASRQTSEEFFDTISSGQSAAIAPEHRTVLRQFLDRCDQVKFARGDLDQAQRKRLHDIAHSFLQTSAATAAPDEPIPAHHLQPSRQH